MDKGCKSYEQKTTYWRSRGQKKGQVFLAITLQIGGKSLLLSPSNGVKKLFPTLNVGCIFFTTLL